MECAFRNTSDSRTNTEQDVAQGILINTGTHHKREALKLTIQRASDSLSGPVLIGV